MLEDSFERPRIAGSDEPEESRGDIHPRHISDPLHVEEMPLQGRQAATSLIVRPLLPQPSRRVQHVEMRHTVERHLHAVERPARLHHGDVEGLAVVGNDQIRIVEKLRDSGQQRALSCMAGEEELTHLEGAEVEVGTTDEKGQRAGTAAEARCFQIDEDSLRRP